MGSTDISSSRYNINRCAEQIYHPPDTALTDGQNRYVYLPRDTVHINRWAAQIYF
jgi:hypothetical protein